jgi:hypothetical protein
MIRLHTKFRIPGPKFSIVIAVKLQDKYRNLMVYMLLKKS